MVHGILGGIPVPFPVPQPDACDKQGLTCPLTKDVAYTFKTKLPIKSSYPAVSCENEFDHFGTCSCV